MPSCFRILGPVGGIDKLLTTNKEKAQKAVSSLDPINFFTSNMKSIQDLENEVSQSTNIYSQLLNQRAENLLGEKSAQLSGKMEFIHLQAISMQN